VAAGSRAQDGGEDSSPRPTWWVLLAVSMAIMALVFAHSAGEHHPQSRAIAINPSILPTFADRSGPSISRTLKQVSPIPSPSSTTTTAVPYPPSDTGPRFQTPPASPVTETAGSVRSYPGYLNYPDDIETSYPIDNVGGNIAASVSFVGDSNVEVSIDCSDAQRSATGTSTVATSLIGATPPCTIEVTDEGVTWEPITYSLIVTTTPGP
jgi:hypothetical protein